MNFNILYKNFDLRYSKNEGKILKYLHESNVLFVTYDFILPLGDCCLWLSKSKAKFKQIMRDVGFPFLFSLPLGFPVYIVTPQKKMLTGLTHSSQGLTPQQIELLWVNEIDLVTHTSE